MNNQKLISFLKVNSKFELTFFCLFLFVSNTAFGQIAANDSLKIEKIITKLRVPESNSQTLIVSNPSDVTFLKSFISKTATQPLQRERVYRINDRKTIGGRYKQGDKSVLPQVLEILNGNDYEAIYELLKQMERQFDDSLIPYALDETVKKRIFDLINVPEIESSIIYFLSQNEIDGRYPLFENHLVSEKSKHEEVLLEKFCFQDNISDKVVNHVCKIIKNNPKPQITGGTFYQIYSQSSPASRKELKNSIYEYFEKNPLKIADFKADEIVSDSTAIETDAEGNQIMPIPDFYFRNTLTEFILSYGDQRNSKLITQLETISANKELSAEQKQNITDLINNAKFTLLDASERKRIVLEKIKKEESYVSYAYILLDDALKNDIELQKATLENGEKLGFFKNEYWANAMKSGFSYLDKNAFSLLIQNSKISDETKNSLLNDNYFIDKETKWLFDNGYKTRTPQQKETFLKNAKEKRRNSIFTTLAINEIGMDLSPEHIFQTENYSIFLEKFISLSNGKIKEVKSCIHYTLDKDNEKLSPRFFVAYKNKCYIIIPEQQSEFCYLNQIRIILDDITKEAGIKEKFFFFDKTPNNQTFGEYCLFGEPQFIEKLAKKYSFTKSVDPLDYH